MTARKGPPSQNSRVANRYLSGVNVQVACHVNTPKRGPNVALSLIDLSEGGARLEVRLPLPPGQEVELKLRRVDLQQSFNVPAEVVWCCASSSRAFHVGLRLLQLLTPQELQDFGRKAAAGP